MTSRVELDVEVVLAILLYKQKETDIKTLNEACNRIYDRFNIKVNNYKNDIIWVMNNYSYYFKWEDCKFFRKRKYNFNFVLNLFPLCINETTRELIIETVESCNL
jgi:hypothetical protein